MQKYTDTELMAVFKMAQLIKLQDYITRYEWDIYRYPGQYIRLKQENWQHLYELWSNPAMKQETTQYAEGNMASRFFKWFRKKDEQVDLMQDQIDNPLPQTEEKLKQYYLNKLFPFQLKWATSTVANVSFMDKKYEYDPTLKFFLQRFPDTYLVMYYPIFAIKKAPVEAEIILVSPIGIEIIYVLDEVAGATIMATDERSWLVERKHESWKMLNPAIALKRTEQIVKSILNKNDISFSVTKTILSKGNNIIFSSEPYNTRIIGTHEYTGWFNAKRSLVSPLKNRQLKSAELLLQHCQTSSVKRPEWEEDAAGFTFVEEDE